MKKFATLLLPILFLSVSLQAAKVAVVSKVQGDVLLQRAADMDYKTAVTMGMILENNDQIKVNDGFAVMLLLDDKSQVKIRENSEVAITMEKDRSGSAYHVRLDYGQALTKYAKGADFEFQLHTPTSVASIKGTQFWTITDPETGDQVIVLEGLVDVMNNLTGMITTGAPGQTVTSGTDGYIESGETEEGTIPEDPEEAFGAADEEPEEEAVVSADSTESTEEEGEMTPEEGTEMADEGMTTPVAPISGPEPEAEGEEEAAEEGGGLFGDALAMDAAFGAVTIDGQLYNQIALRPDISIGKLGVGLDIVLYMDQDGNIRKDEWNDYKDIIDKFMYIRWGEQGDPFFVRVGTLENVVLGYGLFMNGYSNMMEYPSVRKTGHHFGFKLGNFGFENVVANYKEFSFSGDVTGLGVMGVRGTYSLGKLTFGTTLVMDNNQYLGLKDDDGDHIPNLVDDFPDDAAYSKDSDGDGRPDNSPDEWDIDGDGKTDNYTPDPTRNWDDEITRKADPFDISKNPSTVGGISLDIAYPILNMDKFKLVLFAEAGQYFGNADSMYYFSDPARTVIAQKKVEYGMGATAPGLRAQIFNFLTASLEFRITPTGNFIYGLFDRNYDLERVGFVDFGSGMGLVPRTRYEKLYDNSSMMGVFGSVGADLFSLVNLQAGYQHMKSDESEVKGIQGVIGIAPNLIPKVEAANAFILRMNVDDPFDIVSEGTLMGYNVTIGMGGGATLTWKFLQSYIDLNGDNVIDTDPESGEVVAQTSIETGFSF